MKTAGAHDLAVAFIGSPRSGYGMKLADISLLLIARKAGYGQAPRKWRATLTQIRRSRLRGGEQLGLRGA